MTFVFPLALLGLLGALVPPLLHLLQRRQPPSVEFPAVRYLRQTEREAERSIRLRNLLLMTLRMAAVILIVFAAARPVVPRAPVAAGGLHEPTALVLVLDNSLSSGAIARGRAVLDDLVERSRETLREARSGDAVWLMGADLLARRADPERLVETLGGIGADARRLDLSAAVVTAARLVSSSGYAQLEVHVLSDLQRSAFGAPDSGAAGVPVFFYSPSTPPPDNLGVVATRAVPGLWLAGVSGGVVAEVGGGPSRAPARMELLVDGRPGGRAVAASGGTAALEAPPLREGWRTGLVRLQADEFRGDDQRSFAVRVLAPASVAIEPGATLGRFVEEAIAVLSEAGRLRLTPSAEVTLGHVPRGSASVILPPADPTRMGAVNRALAAAGVGWRYGERIERDDSIESLEVPEANGARAAARFRLERSGGGADSAVLARVAGEPWLVRERNVVLVGSRMVPEETTLPVSQTFVPFVSALVNRVSRGEAGVLEAAPGAPVALPGVVTAIATSDTLRQVEPGAVIAAPAVPGVYALLASRDTAALLVVAPDPRESELVRADRAFLEERFPGSRVSLFRDPGGYAAARFHGAGRAELTGWLLAGSLLVLLLEAGVAAGGLRRGS
jgi:hypothetical protein